MTRCFNHCLTLATVLGDTCAPASIGGFQNVFGCPFAWLRIFKEVPIVGENEYKYAVE